MNLKCPSNSYNRDVHVSLKNHLNIFNGKIKFSHTYVESLIRECNNFILFVARLENQKLNRLKVNLERDTDKGPP